MQTKRMLTALSLTAIFASPAFGAMPSTNDTSDYNENTGGGIGALQSGAAAGMNTAYGAWALQADTTGGQNTAVGDSAMLQNTTGGSNTATGVQSLFSNTTGDHNVASGMGALFHNTTGWHNVCAGFNCLYTSDRGGYNTAIGDTTLPVLQSTPNNDIGGNFNTALGWYAGLQLTTGNGNTFLGEEAGKNLTVGSWNIYLGSGGAAKESNVMRLGSDATIRNTYLASVYGHTVNAGKVVVIGQYGLMGTSAVDLGVLQQQVITLQNQVAALTDRLNRAGIPQ